MRFRDYLRRVDLHTAQGPDRLCRVCSRTVVILIALYFWWHFWIFICERTFHQGFRSLQNYTDIHLVLWTEDVLHEELASFWKWTFNGFNRCKSFFGKWCFIRFRNPLLHVDRHTFQGPDSFPRTGLSSLFWYVCSHGVTFWWHPWFVRARSFRFLGKQQRIAEVLAVAVLFTEDVLRE